MLLLQTLMLMGVSILGGALPSSCTQCTSVNESNRWCPVDMTCETQGDCSCGGTACLNFTDCFLQEVSCGDCIKNGGLFCPTMEGGIACVFPNTTAPGSSCTSELSMCPDDVGDQVFLSWVLGCGALAVIASLIVGLKVS
ncbi:hypothetical protein DPX39_070059800 [Trypanosoma brucei equiperdum]|uniref:Uncharacterized protein n=1 Tax=Trypanosoma brucei equiperdum TaxID=630700 RepID=A0A3L6L510_9TRYP|nr:hypothetical protein DPX39_070059800 [Trypanosoma brucei equiperdum]